MRAARARHAGGSSAHPSPMSLLIEPGENGSITLDPVRRASGQST